MSLHIAGEIGLDDFCGSLATQITKMKVYMYTTPTLLQFWPKSYDWPQSNFLSVIGNNVSNSETFRRCINGDVLQLRTVLLLIDCIDYQGLATTGSAAGSERHVL